MKTAETALKNLGLISIIIGILGGVFSIIISIKEGEFFWFLIGLSCIFTAYVSGYLLIGISNIIELLSSLNRTIKNQNRTIKNQSYGNEVNNPAESKNRGWSEISDSIKKK